MESQNIRRAPQQEIQLRRRRISTCEYTWRLLHWTVCTNSSGSNALSSSILECRVYAKKIFKDDFIGGTRDRIKLLLAEGAGRSLYISYWIPFANNHLLLAISQELFKFNSHRNQRKTQIVIEFTIVATSKASNAAGLNMEEAVAQGKNALVHMKLVPLSFEPFQGTVNTSVAVVTNMKSLTTTWGPFLQKFRLFTKLVDGITHVSGQTDEFSAVSDSWGNWMSRSTHTLIWRGASSLL